MAIIYTYPTKATPADADLILISDSGSEDPVNQTKQVTVASIKGLTSGVTSIIAGNNVNITSTGASGTGDVTINASGSGPGTGTEDTVPIWSTTSTLSDSLITQNALGTVLSVGSNIASFSTTAGVGSVFATQVSVNGYSAFGGKLKLGSPDGATPVIIEGPANGGAAYTLKLPSSAPNDNQILEYTTSGNLGWINTPTGGPGSGTQYAIPFWSTTSVLSDSILSQDALATKVVLAATKKLEIPNDGTTSATAINFGTANTGINGSGTTSIGLVSGGQSRIEVTTGFGGGQDITLTGLTQSDGGLRFGSNGETLNSYEEGSWTPTSANANTISSAVGDYTRVGDMVFAQFSFTMTGSTTVAIAGLPFQGVYTSALKGGAIISKNTCLSVQGQLKGGEFTGTNTFTFNAYFGSGTYNPNNPSVAALPYSLYTTTSSLYQTAGGTYAGIIIYETTE